MLVKNIRVSRVGNNHPGISSRYILLVITILASHVSYIIQVLHVQVSHVGNNNPDILC